MGYGICNLKLSWVGGTYHKWVLVVKHFQVLEYKWCARKMIWISLKMHMSRQCLWTLWKTQNILIISSDTVLIHGSHYMTFMTFVFCINFTFPLLTTGARKNLHAAIVRAAFCIFRTTGGQVNDTFLKFTPSLRILGPCNGGVWTWIAGAWVRKIATFEGSGFL